VLQRVAAYCSVLQRIAACCSVLQYVIDDPHSDSVLGIRCCSVLKCAAVCCSLLQCVAAYCSVLQCCSESCRTHKWVVSHKQMNESCHTNKWISRAHPPDPINHYVHLLVNRFQKSILLIIQYRCLKSCSEDFMLQDLILRTRLCGTGFVPQHCWVVHFHPTKIVGWKCFVPVRYQLPKGKLAGLALQYFYIIHHSWGRADSHKSLHTYEWVL